MSKVLWNNKSLISPERVEWFCWFFACSYLHLVGYPLKLPTFAVLSWHCQHRLSANQIVRCFKLKKLENSMRYQIDFLLPLKLHYNLLHCTCFCCLYFQQEITFWLTHFLSMTYVSKMFDSHILTRYSPLWFLDPLKYLSVQFPSCLLAGNTCIRGPFHVSYYLLVFFLYF